MAWGFGSLVWVFQYISVKRLIQIFCVLVDMQIYQQLTNFVKLKIVLYFSQV